jgi:hypothetical protein
MALDTKFLRDRWASKTYEAFQRNAENVNKADDLPGSNGYVFPGTKFDGGIGANATTPTTPTTPAEPNPDPES